MIKLFKKIGGWNIVLFFAFLLLAASIVLGLFLRKDAPARFLFGYKLVSAVDGNMAPEIPKGALLVVKQAGFDEVGKDDNIYYATTVTAADGTKKADKYLVGKVFLKSNDGIRTLFTSENRYDSYQLTRDDVKGKVVTVFHNAKLIYIPVFAFLTILFLLVVFFMLKDNLRLKGNSGKAQKKPHSS